MYIVWQDVSNAENALTARLSQDLLVVGSPLLPHLLTCSRSFVASRWRALALSSSRSGGAWRAKHLAAGGLYRQEGVLWVVAFSPLKPGANDMFYCKFHDRKLHRVSLPARLRSPLVSVSAAPEALWILSARGEVFARTETTADRPEGDGGWRRLDLSQLEREGAGWLRSLSLGSDAAWAADANGKVWMRLGPLAESSSSSHARQPTPVWIPVDGVRGGSAAEEGQDLPRLAKVAASTSIHIVWALDEKGRVYVRDGIFPDFRSVYFSI